MIRHSTRRGMLAATGSCAALFPKPALADSYTLRMSIPSPAESLQSG